MAPAPMIAIFTNSSREASFVNREAQTKLLRDTLHKIRFTNVVHIFYNQTPPHPKDGSSDCKTPSAPRKKRRGQHPAPAPDQNRVRGPASALFYPRRSWRSPGGTRGSW